MTVRHTLASLDDEQARDLLLRVARGQEEMRCRLSQMLDSLMGAEADEACGAAYMTRGEGRVNRRNGYFLCSLGCGRFRHFFWTVVAFILDGVVGCGIGHRCRPVSR